MLEQEIKVIICVSTLREISGFQQKKTEKKIKVSPTAVF